MEHERDSFRALVSIVEHLRSPGGCPWDREQTHHSLKRNLLEECYEVLEAIDGNEPAKLSEELGDILAQVVFHSQMAREAQAFSVDDVVTGVSRKLIRRHPHVFGNAVASDAREVELNWERLKEGEGVRSSPVEGIPKELPALAYAQLMQDRVAKVGFEWEDVSGVLDKLVEEVNELRSAPTDEERAKEMGDLLFTMVNLARWTGIHAEDALRQANTRFQGRYTTMERLASQRGLDFPALPLEEKEALWQEAKLIAGDEEVSMDRKQELIFLVEESVEGGYEARALGESIYTEADTLKELREAIADAVRCHFEEADRPHLVRLHFVREEVLSV